MILTNIHWSRESLQEFIHKFPPKKYGVISYELWTITEVLHANMPCHHRDGILGCDAPKRHIFLCFLCDPVDRAQAMLNPCYTYQSLACGRVGPTFGSPFHDGVCRSPLLGTNFGEPSQTRPFPKTTRIRTETRPEFADSLLGQWPVRTPLGCDVFLSVAHALCDQSNGNLVFAASAPTEMAEVTMRYKMV